MSSIKETADKYREEMMRLYGSKISSQKKEPPQKQEAVPNAAEPVNEPAVSGETEGSVESRYPMPEIPDFIRQPEPSSEATISDSAGVNDLSDGNLQNPAPDAPSENYNEMPDSAQYEEPLSADPQTSSQSGAGQQIPPSKEAVGYLLVQVRTGDGGIPVENAAVTVSRNENGKEVIYRLSVTGKSGETELIELPVYKMTSNPNSPEDYEKSTDYDVSVYIKDYFRVVSRNVPVFDGIKSIQTFNLIPIPFSGDPDQTIFIRNTEPSI